jgi:hypothetical protein
VSHARQRAVVAPRLEGSLVLETVAGLVAELSHGVPHSIGLDDASSTLPGGSSPSGARGGSRSPGLGHRRGYLHDPAASAALHHGAWLDTGDLGYFAGGDPYVTGRIKDIVIPSAGTSSPGAG